MKFEPIDSQAMADLVDKAYEYPKEHQVIGYNPNDIWQKATEEQKELGFVDEAHLA